MRQTLIRKLTAAVAAVAILATATEAVAGPTRRLYPGNAHTWQIQVFAGTPVNITVDGDGDPRADLDLFVYDQWGNLVDVDDDYTDYCLGSFVPRRSGIITIRIENVGRVYNDYELRVSGGRIR